MKFVVVPVPFLNNTVTECGRESDATKRSRIGLKMLLLSLGHLFICKILDHKLLMQNAANVEVVLIIPHENSF